MDEITKSPAPTINVYNKSVAELQDKEMYSKEVMDQLILSYLIHHGYTGTAKAIVQNAGHVSGQELFLSDDISEVSEKDMEERQG
jgi:ABC-type iron transport system FetAB ATPase subunit